MSGASRACDIPPAYRRTPSLPPPMAPQHRLPVEPRPLLPAVDVPARLRLSTAWHLVELAQLKPGDVVCDPMCGVGTIPLEAAAGRQPVLALGGDLCAGAVQQAQINSTAFADAQLCAHRQGLTWLPVDAGPGPCDQWHHDERRYRTRPGGGGVGVCVWDANKLPLRDACVDAVVVDPPFGMVHRAGSGLKRLYSGFLLETARVLRPGGRCVILTPTGAAVQDSLCALWEQESQFIVNSGGQLAYVFVWRRSPAALEPNARSVLYPARAASVPAAATRMGAVACETMVSSRWARPTPWPLAMPAGPPAQSRVHHQYAWRDTSERVAMQPALWQAAANGPSGPFRGAVGRAVGMAPLHLYEYHCGRPPWGSALQR